MRVGITLSFDAAHHLVGAGICENTHGHTYVVEATAKAAKGDRGALEALEEDLAGLIKAWDHKDLNQVMEYPSAENMVESLYKALKKSQPGLVSLRLYEGVGKWAEAHADDPLLLDAR